MYSLFVFLVGGLWRYKEDDQSVTTAMDGTITNFSKHRVRELGTETPERSQPFRTDGIYGLGISGR
jgi:hypothetical protein